MGAREVIWTGRNFRTHHIYMGVDLNTGKRFECRASVVEELWREKDFAPVFEHLTEELRYKLVEHLGLRNTDPKQSIAQYMRAEFDGPPWERR